MVSQRPPSEADMAELARLGAKNAGNEFNEILTTTMHRIMCNCSHLWQVWLVIKLNSYNCSSH